MEIHRGTEAPPWFTGWIALIPCLLIGGAFLYYGLKFKKEDCEKMIQEEDLPWIFRILPWWFSKLFYIVLGLAILGVGIGYFINVPEEFF